MGMVSRQEISRPHVLAVEWSHHYKARWRAPILAFLVAVKVNKSISRRSTSIANTASFRGGFCHL